MPANLEPVCCSMSSSNCCFLTWSYNSTSNKTRNYSINSSFIRFPEVLWKNHSYEYIFILLLSCVWLFATPWTIQSLEFSKAGFSNMWTMNFQMFKLVIEKAEEPEIKLPTSAGSSKNKRVPEKHLFLLYWLCQSLWLCGSQQTVENSKRDRNTRQPSLPPEKSVCRSKSKVTAGYGTTDWF